MNSFKFLAIASLAFLSCTKNSLIVQTQNRLDDHLKFSTYGIESNGLTDVTQDLQKLLDTSSIIYLKAGVYTISNTLNIKSNTKLIGEKGTIIKGGKDMTGTLLEFGRYIFAERANNTTIQQITFRQSESSYSYREWNNACIFLLNCKTFNVESCFFDFHLSYQTLGQEAVWVSGSESHGNTIQGNEINTLGIRYAENGADGTLVKNNVLNKSYSNALSASGNHKTDLIVGCRILNNKIFDAGRMGIEDWGNTDGSIIEGNLITGTGKDSKQAIDGIALSAVGINSSVLNNTISDSQIYAIEVRGNYGSIVKENKIFANPNSTAVILNYTFTKPSDKLPLARVENNNIKESKIGVHIFGDYESHVLIYKNSFQNIDDKAISIESGARKYIIDLRANHYTFNKPNQRDRFALFSYTHFRPGVADQVIKSLRDTITFTSSSNGGAGVDFGFVIRTDRASIDQLTVRANNVKNSSKVPVNAFTALGGRPISVVLRNSNVKGGRVDLVGFKDIKLSNNTFSQ